MAKKPKYVGCTVRKPPAPKLVAAARHARRANPANRPSRDALTAVVSALLAEGVKPADITLDHPRIAILTTRYWGPSGVHLTVGFMENTRADLQDKILGHMNAWAEYGNVQFTLAKSASQADVRISRGPGGYWSYLGTDVRQIPKSQPTMNLEGFVLKTPESEYRRVVRHETGHTLGAPHEHMRKEIVARIDPDKAIRYFGATQGWSADEVQQQVLTALDDSELTSLPADVLSIMCYALPGSITVDGKEIPGGTDINAEDGQLIAKLYPKAVTPPPPPPGPPAAGKLTVVLSVDGAAKTVTVVSVT